MDDEPTCGKGLAEHAALPATLAQLIAAVADNLHLHMRALDDQDPDARKEHQAYQQLVTQHRQAAEQLQQIARNMAGYRDLPMGVHHMQAMTGPDVVQAFERFVTAQEQLLTLVQGRLAEDRQMLADMRAGE